MKVLSNISLELWLTIIGSLITILGFIYKIRKDRIIDNRQIPSIFNEGFKKPLVRYNNDVVMYLKDNSHSERLNVKIVYVKRKFWPFGRKVKYHFKKTPYEGDYRLDVETKIDANNFKLKIITNFGKLIVPFKDVYEQHRNIIQKIDRNDE